MIAVQYRKSVPRYLALKTIGRRFRSLCTSGLSPVSLVDIPAPDLPTARWARIEPRLAGICGSDLATVCAKGSAYLSPLTSMPFVLGHEVVGRVVEVGAEVASVSVGDRVVIQPALGCVVRGIHPPCPYCAQGQLALCRNVTAGDISAGIQTGYCRDTGGAWSESLVAHESQLYRVPDTLDDELAVLTEPFACALHGALRALPAAEDVVLVMGCGSIGLLTICALRALAGSKTRIVAVGKYAHQCDIARRLGADLVLPFRKDLQQRYGQLAQALNAEVLPAEIGKPTVIGGAGLTFDCVASSASIDDCCRFTASGGRVVLVGMPGVPSGVDWTAIWYKELAVHAAYAYGREQRHGRTQTTFDLALELLGSVGDQVRDLVGQPFALRDYRAALSAALNVSLSQQVKTVFRVQGT